MDEDIPYLLLTPSPLMIAQSQLDEALDIVRGVIVYIENTSAAPTAPMH